MALKTLPPVELLRERFDYDPESGTLVHRKRARDQFKSDHDMKKWNSKWAGKRAGCLRDDGRWLVGVNNTNYYLHRIVWKMHHGVEPPKELDHWNRDGGNNRIANLRAATSSQQKWNMSISTRNKSGYKGVSWDKWNHEWHAAIGKDGKTYNLGGYATAEEAAEVYRCEARRLFGEFWTDGT